MLDTLPTIRELDAAIMLVLTEPVYQAMRLGGAGRTRLHDMAIRKAFVSGAPERTCAVLRHAAQEIDRIGFYPPEMWEGTNDY
ncbi:hypothetical protein [Gluconacetobacter diazotrophicus]|uniref:hypothetical protein n=1 Tax=Gluconacetobacter diazotrophicus TaxID=33996 RepID=UPI0005BBE45A|nr:hypothetical protein [Gluconacetobacter diazotrophicus]TWB00406.1 hypothetical protein FBZ86_13720 [Gluconacetobacter diazotrophicus]